MDYTMEAPVTGAVEAQMPMAPAARIGSQELLDFLRILRKYKAGKANTESRIIASENWWKLRNAREEGKGSRIGADGGFTSASGWLHNVITSKHADLMESYPEPNILPREPSDQEEAKRLSSILPCVLEQNDFEESYSEVGWQKLKTGTGAYKIVWDSGKLNGLGDISITKCNLLNLYWEPGVTDIQQGRYFFHTELMDREVLEENFPQVKDKVKNDAFVSAKFLYDDNVSTDGKVTVIEVYYHRMVEGMKTLQYCKFVGDQVLFATENDPEMAVRGLYDHGLYPYVFDVMYPIEGSPCGYGYVDLCKNPQMEIDLLKTSMVKNAQVGSIPRFFSRQDGNINEQEFLDLSRPIVHVSGNIGEESIRQIPCKGLDGIYLNVLEQTVQELRETSGNTETATGTAGSGVTAASAIAALQEASGKGSRDSTRTTYRAYSGIISLCIELIRQFYEMPRQFRILGEYGAQEFISYSNQGLVPQHQGSAFGQDLGYRKPVFDIKISAQRQNVYTKVSQNELALQFYQMGFFNPQMTDQALLCLQIMDFDGKDRIMQGISRNGTMMEKLQMYLPLAMAFAQASGNMQMAQMIAMDMQSLGLAAPPMAQGSGDPQLEERDNLSGQTEQEPRHMEKARARSNDAAQPGGGAVIKERA